MTITQSQMQKKSKKFSEKRSEFIDEMIDRHGEEKVREQLSDVKKEQILNDVVMLNVNAEE